MDRLTKPNSLSGLTSKSQLRLGCIDKYGIGGLELLIRVHVGVMSIVKARTCLWEQCLGIYHLGPSSWEHFQSGTFLLVPGSISNLGLSSWEYFLTRAFS